MDKGSTLDLQNYKNRLGLKNKAGRAIWFVAYWLLFRPFAGRPLQFWRNLILRIFGAKITGNPLVFASAKIWAPWNLEINNACISYNCRVYNVDKVIIEEFAVISHNVHLCSASHDISSPTYELVHEPIRIGKQAWVAADSFIGPGIDVGEGAVVAARAVVTKDVAPWTVVGGNPAVKLKERTINKT
ncbi:putative colanic acid biosynthesis acetyltransferase WcaF [Robiginitalea myxolifaciens]|uniref:Putative colanic acid biosynthesis acetyltransferase WcaF n=1 Tax=Robiginitalea myxolifaciens TaxID=400055 RepID=A0A1I6FN22_9FLAO|nr:hypothetical protein [Robiginitalea myxolifaciens]SFR31331.1 putative colanic acid biosynthesis acetyltransferase WcaF [Robiginitalea myxolifaciens]